MAKQNDAVDAPAEEIVPVEDTEATQSGEPEVQAPVAEQHSDAPTDAPVAEEKVSEEDGEQNDASALTTDAVKTIIDEALAPLFARLAALEKTADTNEVNKLAGRLRHIEQRVRGFF